MVGLPTTAPEVSEDLITKITIGLKDIVLVQVYPDRTTIIRIIGTKFVGTILLCVEVTMEHDLVVVVAIDLRNNCPEGAIAINTHDITGELSSTDWF